MTLGQNGLGVSPRSPLFEAEGTVTGENIEEKSEEINDVATKLKVFCDTVENLSQDLEKQGFFAGKWLFCLCKHIRTFTMEILLNFHFECNIQKLTGYVEGFYEEVTEDIRRSVRDCPDIGSFKSMLKESSRLLSFSHKLFVASSRSFSKHSSFQELTKALFKLKAALDYIFIGSRLFKEN